MNSEDIEVGDFVCLKSDNNNFVGFVFDITVRERIARIIWFDKECHHVGNWSFHYLKKTDKPKEIDVDYFLQEITYLFQFSSIMRELLGY